MFEFLFLIFFIVTFAIFGISFLSVTVAVIVGIAFMFIMGMLGLIVKMLPWLIVIGLIILLVRHKRVR
ncbi:envelope stress response protein PspG [Vibrio sp. WJH972]